jgi:exosortase A
MIGAGVADRASGRELVVLALIAGVAAFVVILYVDTFASMATIWQSSGYGHGLIVPPICAYLLWRLRGPLAGIELRPCIWGIGLVVGIVGLWFVARAVAVQVVEYFAAMALIPATILAFLGWSLAHRAMFPLLFLLAAVPVGDGLLPHLMLLTADTSTALLRAVGVPVFREGQFLSLPGGNFEVASVCAGLAYLTAGTVIALLFSYFTYQSLLKRFVFVLLTMVLVVFTNGLRAFVIMYVASATDMRYLTGRDHVLFGWVLFGIVVASLLYFGGRFADEGMREERLGASSSSQRTRSLPMVLVFGLLMLAATAQPLQTGLRDRWLWVWPVTGLLLWTLYKTIDSRQASSTASAGAVHYRSLQGIVVLSIVPVILAAGPGLLPRAATGSPVEPLPVELRAIEECRPAGAWSESWLPEFHQPDTVMSGTYLCSGQPVSVFVVEYIGNTQGRELVNDSNKAVPDALQRRAPTRKHGFTSKDGQVIQVNELKSDLPGSSSLVWYWYQIGETAATDPVFVKLRQAFDLLLMRRVDGVAYVLDTPLREDVETSRERLARVASQLAARATVGGAENTSLVER